MLMYYRPYRELVSKKLLRKYSPHDVIIHLSGIEKLRINGQWALYKIPKTSRNVVEKLEFEPLITQDRLSWRPTYWKL